MTKAMIVILGLTAGFAASAAWGLAWAARTGQFSRLNAAARGIFDDEEPVGRVTDAFPGEKPEPGDEAAPAHAPAHAPAKGGAKR
jgi:nitrogen fixation-related uncharacterized protein